MSKSLQIQYLFSKKSTRIELCKRSFKYFFQYYLNWWIQYNKFANYHLDRFKAVDKWINVYCEWHRDSAKTTILGLAVEIRKICYNKSFFICNLCYDKKKAQSFNYIIVSELLKNKLIKEDFGILFSKKNIGNTDEEELKKTGISEFITISWIKVKAFWMWEAIRWEIHNHKTMWIVRPSHIMLDDIDNTWNTKNTKIIDSDMDFIKWEVFWGMEWLNSQVIWIGNVVRQDWRNIRQKRLIAKNNAWKVFSNFIYWEAGSTSWDIQRDRFVETEAEALEINKIAKNKVLSLEKKREVEGTWFTQNWIWVGIKIWDIVIKPEWIKIDDTEHEYSHKVIWVDPAFSLKNKSDPIGIVIVWFFKKDWVNYKHILYSTKLVGKDKDEVIFENKIKALYKLFWTVRINIEGNVWWEVLGRLLKKKWLAVDIVRAAKDKITRLKENEWEFMLWHILFKSCTQDLIDQLLLFTWEDWNEDDMVEAMVWGLKQKALEFRLWSL